MEQKDYMKLSVDDIVFEGRNKSYGAYILRRIYDSNMTRATILALLLFVLAISMPMIIKLVKGWIPEKQEKEIMKEVVLSDAPPLDPKKPPPPPPPKVEPPPIKDQIKFVPPKVKKDEEVKDEEPPPPTIEEMKDKEIATETKEGEEGGIDESLLPPPPPVVEEPVKEEAPFKFVEQMPSFPDGEAAMLKYIRENIKYPAIAKENGIEGTVVVQFVVTRDGDIQKVMIARGIGGGCDEEAARVVKGMPNWKPGKHNGKAVPVSFTLPIRFKLEG
ncbi:MAG TPA: energy transducer TonB [Saprospiraceae bacterium]|nr:energy transducer TonB [Saprospiraceae bacterium]